MQSASEIAILVGEFFSVTSTVFSYFHVDITQHLILFHLPAALDQIGDR